MVSTRYCEHGNLRLTCKQCRIDAVTQAEARAAENRERGESHRQGMKEEPVLHYPWQRESFSAWQEAGRTGLVALSPGLPEGDLPFAAIADQLGNSGSANVLLLCSRSKKDGLVAALGQRFGLQASTLLDHHYMEPKDDATILVADLEEIGTVDIASWGRFASTGLLLLLDADGVSAAIGSMLMQSPFPHRLSISRQPSACDLLMGRPWSPAFGPLLYRCTEAQARDMGVLPQIDYRLHVRTLKPDTRKKRGPVGPWEPTDVPTRIGAVSAGQFVRGRARDVAIEIAKEEPDVVVVHDGVDVREAMRTVPSSEIPESYDKDPVGWVLAEPAAQPEVVLRVATVSYKVRKAPSRVDDTVVLPAPADLCQTPPWSEAWHATAVQLDRVSVGFLLAEKPGEVVAEEDLESLVGAALALRGLEVDELYRLTPVVSQAAQVAARGEAAKPDLVQEVTRTYGGLAAALMVAAQDGPAALLRLAHPRFTPPIPDLPHPSLYDARRHAWRGSAFASLAQAARGDLVRAWGTHPELRFIFPSSQLLEIATRYCEKHRLRGALDDLALDEITTGAPVSSVEPEHAARAAEVLTEWSDALSLAEQHERKFLADMHRRQPERERRREGMALPNLEVLDRGRDRLVLQSTTGRFPATNIAPGSEVAIVPFRERNELGRAVVQKIDTRRLTIEFENGRPDRLPKRITVNLMFDAKVFEAYRSAVQGAVRALGASKVQDESPDGLLRACLLGETGKPKPQPFDVKRLTPSQREAIESVLAGGRVRLVHGPPGTGKTHTLVHLAMALTRAGHSVLATADSNAAVDNMVVGLRRAGALVLRIGHAPNIRDPNALPARVDPIDAPLITRWAARHGIIVATTNYGAFRYIDAKGGLSAFTFDYVVHDEAGQSTAPSSLAAVMRGRRLVLAGDPLQLPPTVVSMDAKHAGLDVTLFERIEELTGKERTKLLATQFRMRQEICDFSNKRFYDGRIETHESAASQEGMEGIPPVAFQHVTGLENARQKNGSISNDYEVEAVADILDKLRPQIREAGWTVAVLTPYQAQRERLRRRLGEIEVSTVDGAQGREWDVVFYSSVRSNPRHRLGFLSDERRLNVAVTRARRNFVLVGDERTLRAHKGFSQLLDGAKKVRMHYPDKKPPIGGGSKGQRKGKRKKGRRGPPRGAPRHGKKGDQSQGGAKKPRRGSESAGQSGDGRKRGSKRPAGKHDAEQGGRGHGGPAGAPPRGRKQGKDGPGKGERQSPAKKKSGDTGPGCGATTKKGTPCRYKARPGGRFCGRHGG